jgi:glucans biosynthesis protein
MKTHLVFAFMTIALLAFVISQSRTRTLQFDTVIAQARELSEKPFKPSPRLAPTLRALNYDQTRDIRYKPEASLWRRQGLPFQIRFFYAAGETDSTPVTIYQVNRNGAGPLRFSPDFFTFGPLVPPLTLAEKSSGGYSGFRLYYPMNKPNRLDEVAAFQGASYFRPLARNLNWGASARGVAIDTTGKEDFPRFTSFWLVEPPANATEMTFFALLDGRDLTGAYEFRIAPGPETRIHVRAMLFPRRAVKDAGFAPLTSMYWYGENTSNTFGGWRPEVHDSDGLQILRANGEWLWHPLAWAKERQVNVFEDAHPRGFGLFQRDRDFSHYQDLEANYHLRPSLWVEPEGDWGDGSVVLMQNPTSDEFSDNIVAYWRPRAGLQPGQSLEVAYTLVTFATNGGLPPLGRCLSTRIDYQEKPNYRYVALIFSGGPLAGLPADVTPKPDIWVGEKGALSGVQCVKIPGTNNWQVSFGVTGTDGAAPVEMRCALLRDEKPLTETWTYTWVK